MILESLSLKALMAAHSYLVEQWCLHQMAWLQLPDDSSPAFCCSCLKGVCQEYSASIQTAATHRLHYARFLCAPLVSCTKTQMSSSRSCFDDFDRLSCALYSWRLMSLCQSSVWFMARQPEKSEQLLLTSVLFVSICRDQAIFLSGFG